MSTLAIEHDPELRYCKPGETQTERLLRAVDELRDELATAADEWRSVDERAYEAEHALDDLRSEVRMFIGRVDYLMEVRQQATELDDWMPSFERLLSDFEQAVGL